MNETGQETAATPAPAHGLGPWWRHEGAVFATTVLVCLVAAGLFALKREIPPAEAAATPPAEAH